MNYLNISATPRQELAPDARDWAAHASALAAWAASLVNRWDLHGRYKTPEARRPDPETGRTSPSFTANFKLELVLLRLHFRGLDQGDLVGLHVMSADETCKWIVIDFDAHDDGDDPKANWAMSRDLYGRVKALGFDALLLDSNGKGGFHLWVLFAHPVPGRDAWRLGKWLVHDHRRFGLAKPPETFPKSPRHSGKRIGPWVRLPGRHHTRDHWTRVWDGRRWLAGEAAIRAILAVRGRDIDLTKVIPADFDPQREHSRRRRQPVPASCTTYQRRRDVALARQALTFLGDDYRDDYDEWLRVGMALSELGDEGLDLWHEWSEPSAKYEPCVLDQKWAGFAAGTGISLGSLFHMAKQEGWSGPPKQVSGLTRHRGTFTIRVPHRDASTVEQ